MSVSIKSQTSSVIISSRTCFTVSLAFCTSTALITIFSFDSTNESARAVMTTDPTLSSASIITVSRVIL